MSCIHGGRPTHCLKCARRRHFVFTPKPKAKTYQCPLCKGKGRIPQALRDNLNR